ncbi:MAG TPA: Ig-like domain-containing protein [Ferruginibacter sp.]|nr:Ig-like domain-containing protein [Ferruginibacter sp.]HMP19745.1 Ig-like domain-containing protein [Ferruginibacter sp.]
MRISNLLCVLAAFLFLVTTVSMLTGCAQIGTPTGGPRDSIPPVLIAAVPQQYSTNFTGNKITLSFDEYIVVDDVQKNVVLSPYPKSNPQVDFKLRTVTVKLKDTLAPNTTYAIDFGNAIKDNNEGNVFRNFTYVFSTGDTIDSLTLSGEVILAETGKKDSTIIAMLYRNAHDTTVQIRKPDYIARLNGDGRFTFRNLSAGSYKVYALKDEDGRKMYNSKTKIFAFADTDILVSDSTAPVTLYAYAEEKVKATTTQRTLPEKKLRYTTTVSDAPQSLLRGLDITFNRPLKQYDASKIILTDSAFNPVAGTAFSLDSNSKILTLSRKWSEGTAYNLIIDKAAVTDTLGEQIFKTDTIAFKTKTAEDYGTVLLRFTNIDTAKHQVLLLMRGDEVYTSFSITGPNWSDKYMEPGEYELRVLYDDNRNGKWDTGSYENKRQPEKAITLDKKLTIRSNWENERDIEL